MQSLPGPHDILTVHEPLAVNTVGHSAGALVFGIFIILLLRDRGRTRLRGSRLSLAAAGLAFLWNAASLAVMAQEAGGQAPSLALVALSTSLLSLLPAVLLHLSLAGRFRWIALAGYTTAVLSVAIHWSELFYDAPDNHRIALWATTLGFGALTPLSAALAWFAGDLDRKRIVSRILGSMSLFLFAMSFVHLGSAQPHASWPLELLAHHAGIPLALFVLLQDYRFLMLDAFIRFLANILFAGVFTLVAAATASALELWSWAAGHAFRQGLLLVIACLALILFSFLRPWVQRLLTRIVFRRPRIETAVRELRPLPGVVSTEREYLDWAARRMAAFVEADLVEAPPGQLDLRSPTPVSDMGESREAFERAGIEAIVPLRPGPGETHYLFLGRRRGGRRYLSEDLAALGVLAAEAAIHIEQFREAEMRRLISQAELRALESQIHPHFLFNALNALYGVIPREAAGARRMVLNLADIFRYFLKSERTYIPLAEELAIVRAYLEIEGLRLGPRLRTEIDVSPGVLAELIPVLSVEPLVENAVKHGVAAKAGGGLVRVEAWRDGGAVRIRVSDTGNGFPQDGEQALTHGQGAGLDNVVRRLRLCYGPGADIRIQSSESGAVVEFQAPVRRAQEAVR